MKGSAGILLGWVFCALWWVIGSAGLAPRWRLPAGAAGLAATAAAVVWQRRRRAAGPRPETPFRMRPYLLAILFEGLAIPAAAIVLWRAGAASYFVTALGVIVGLHFIGLGKATRLDKFFWVAAGLCLASGLAALLPGEWRGASPRLLATGYAIALILAAAALVTPSPSASSTPVDPVQDL